MKLLKKIVYIVVDVNTIFLLGIFFLLPSRRLKIGFGHIINRVGIFLSETPIFRNDKPNRDESEVPIEKPEPIKNDKDRICIQFSGGTDSMLNAVLLSRHFKYVDLITFKHSGLKNINNSGKSALLLKRHFKDWKFSHKIIDIDHDFERDFFNKMHPTIFGIHACANCRRAFHKHTIGFCKKHKIKYVSSGIVSDAQLTQSITYDKWSIVPGLNYYKKNGITYIINPGKDVYHPDAWLFEHGIIRHRQVKNKRLTYRYQPSCAYQYLFDILYTRILLDS